MAITFYTDDVKGDQAFDGPLKDVKPTSIDEMNGTGSNSCNHLQLPKDVEVSYIYRNFDLMENSINHLTDEIKFSVRMK